jgi:hypothetical protein
MSALPPKADIRSPFGYVRFGSKADIPLIPRPLYPGKRTSLSAVAMSPQLSTRHRIGLSEDTGREKRPWIDVCFGSKADMAACPINVRFTPKSGHFGVDLLHTEVCFGPSLMKIQSRDRQHR